MTTERWQQINAVLDAVLEQPPDQRNAYLDAHCKDDPDLRREVASLMEAYDQTEDFLEEPAKEFAASLIPVPDDDTDALIGQTVDGYRILSVLGRGGMGIVYKAEDEALSRTVAVKMIDPTLARDEAFVYRFRREARALARIDNRHIVGVHTMRQTEAGLFIVMEYVDGGTVTDLLDGGPLSWQQALPIIQQMLSALEHAHSAGVVHRDIKPSNIMLTGQGVVKVTDFGLAKVRSGGGATTVTQGIAGTLYYMSPEQVKGARDLDYRSDLYSMGVTIYKMLTGHLPLDPDAGEFAIMRSIVEDDLPPPSMARPGLSAAFDAAVMKALAKDPTLRYQSAAEMRAAFEALQPPLQDAKTVIATETPYKPERPERPARSPALRVGAAVLGVAVLALAVYYLWPKPDSPSLPDPPQLALTTSPDQAVVFLDGDSIGTTPIEAYRLQAGIDRVVLRIQKPDYAAVETTLTVIGGALPALNIDLERLLPVDSAGPIQRATLRITSSSGNARVQINGDDYGVTDASGVLEVADVEPGRVTVLITKSGYNDWRETLEVEAGQTVPLPATLAAVDAGAPEEERRGTLTVQVIPSGTVRVQGENCRIGTPCRVRAGIRRVTCTSGGATASTTVRIRAGQTRSLTCYTERNVAVQVRNEAGEEPWGTIFIDGENQGQFSDKVFTLGSGEHRIAVRRNEYDILTAPQTIRIEPAFAEQQREVLVFLIRKQ